MQVSQLMEGSFLANLRIHSRVRPAISEIVYGKTLTVALDELA